MLFPGGQETFNGNSQISSSAVITSAQPFFNMEGFGHFPRDLAVEFTHQLCQLDHIRQVRDQTEILSEF